MKANGKPLTEEDKFHEFREIVANELTFRQQFVRQMTDPRRDIYAECGYPTQPTPQLYQDLYDRDDIAARVVEVYPRESWQTQPLVYESEDANTITPFEEAWDALGSGLRGELSWFAEEKGSPVYDYLKRLDEQAGIGSYGVLLLGLDDGKSLDQPADMQPPGKGRGAKGETARKLLFLRVFPESLATIAAFESNPRDPRYGQPITYTITLNDAGSSQTGMGLSTATVNVHWSRVVHVADNLSSSEIFGAPRMRPVLNRLLDLRKLYGGSAEMYWRGALPGWSFETHPQLGGDVSIDPAGLRDMMENYANGLQRFIATMGMSAKSLAPQVVDPSPQIERQIEAICIKLGIPVRVFKGSERGELASSQDDAAWNDRLRERQNAYITPRIIVPFVDRLISLGVLPQPESYCVEWPDLASQTKAEQASVAVQKTQAISTYVSSGADSLIPPLDFFTIILGMTEDEGLAILENAAKALEGEGEEPTGGSPLLGLVGGITGMLELFQKHKDGALSEESLKELIKLFYGVDDAKAEQIIADGLPEPEEPPAPLLGQGPPAPGGNPFAKKPAAVPPKPVAKE